MKQHTKNKTHWYRRSLHVFIGCIPFIYYALEPHISKFLKCKPMYWLSGLLIVLSFIEYIRIKNNWLILGQRDYERGTISSLFWTGLGLIIVLIAAPVFNEQSWAFSIPIIWSLALGDPILGEGRLRHVPLLTTLVVTYTTLAFIWGIACWMFGIPLWLILVMPVLSILGESLPTPKIDDNFNMLMLPLLFILAIY